MLNEPKYLKSTALSKQFQELDELPAYVGLTATVVIARNRETDDLVAVKVVDKRKLCVETVRSHNGLGDKSELSRAQAEIQVHASLAEHTNVVPLIAHEEALETLFFVTPYAPDGDLWQHIRFSATLTEKEARACIHQVAFGLEGLHSRGIVHGDIKPHNILLFRARGCPSNRLIAQLCDFGLSEEAPMQKCGTRIIRFTGMRGSSGYFAPELVNEEDYSCGVDVFALGVVLFRLLSGYEPFYPPTKFETGVEFDDACWDHITEDCKDVIRCMLEINQRNRMPLRELLNHKWFFRDLPTDPTAESVLYFYGPNEIPGPIETKINRSAG